MEPDKDLRQNYLNLYMSSLQIAHSNGLEVRARREKKTIFEIMKEEGFDDVDDSLAEKASKVDLEDMPKMLPKEEGDERSTIEEENKTKWKKMFDRITEAQNWVAEIETLPTHPTTIREKDGKDRR